MAQRDPGARAGRADVGRELGAGAVAAVAVLELDEKVFARYLDEPTIPDVDLFVRSSGEQRISNFLLWQSAYAELVFLDTLWPDFDRRHLWHACEIYASRDRRYGGAVPNPVPEPPGPTFRLVHGAGRFAPVLFTVSVMIAVWLSAPLAPVTVIG